MPSYSELMAETDALGTHRSYLATEENYRALRELEMNNLIVPIVGDFAGEKALRAVGAYLKQHNATVTAFYTSNVEQYLFQQADDWKHFFGNVAALPLDSKSTFIRAVFNYMGFRDSSTGIPGPRSTTMLSPIQDVLKAVDDGKDSDVLRRHPTVDCSGSGGSGHDALGIAGSGAPCLVAGAAER